jgi:hypothetical protein
MFKPICNKATRQNEIAITSWKAKLVNEAKTKGINNPVITISTMTLMTLVTLILRPLSVEASIRQGPRKSLANKAVTAEYDSTIIGIHKQTLMVC